MSRSFWPGRLLSNKPRKITVLEGGPLMSKKLGNLPVLLPPKDKLSVMTDHPKFSERFRAEDDFRAALIRVMKRPGGAPQPLTENVEARKYLRASCLYRSWRD